MRRKGCRNEDHFLEAKGLPDLLCSPEMTQMDGVEGPPEKPDPSLSSILLNLGLSFSGQIRNPNIETLIRKE
jgi:hypothetical protein